MKPPVFAGDCFARDTEAVYEVAMKHPSVNAKMPKRLVEAMSCLSVSEANEVRMWLTNTLDKDTCVSLIVLLVVLMGRAAEENGFTLNSFLQSIAKNKA